MNSQDSLAHLRHSCAHLLAAAVTELWPHALHTIGPAIDDGFYYDFDFGETKISDDDLPTIEEKMRALVKEWREFRRIETTRDSAIAQFKNNTYKKELIETFAEEGQQLTLYESGSFTDLCRGGHVDHPDRVLKHFKLLSIAGAYWRGDAKNKMLTRIYGTAFSTKKELDDYLQRREEAKKRDHKKLGRELDLFVFADEVGPGLPLMTEKGAAIYRELERFVIDEEIRRGYVHVRTPDLARVKLYEISGHYPYYKDSMYPVMQVDDEQLVLRPMTCPHHFVLYKSKLRSYRDLPLRLAEVAKLYRYEQSGELMGLLRVRSFCLADSHIFCRQSQAATVVKEVIDLIDFVAQSMGLIRGTDYWFRLSLGDVTKKDKYYDDPENWKIGEATLKAVLDEIKAPYREAPNEAAFYGPKIDIQMVNVNGKEDTAFTVQYDFCLPARFELEYTSEEGKPERPVVIHRSSIGAIERTMAFLIERYAGAFPVWLAPTQVQIIPVSIRHNEYCSELIKEFRDHHIRCEVDDANETVGNKIRKAVKMKIPYLLVIGDKEMTSPNLHIRKRGTEELIEMPKDQFINHLLQECRERKIW